MMHDSKCGCPNCVDYGSPRAYKAEERPDKKEIPFTECRNTDCPIGCPDSHCMPPADFRG